MLIGYAAYPCFCKAYLVSTQHLYVPLHQKRCEQELPETAAAPPPAIFWFMASTDTVAFFKFSFFAVFFMVFVLGMKKELITR